MSDQREQLNEMKKFMSIAEGKDIVVKRHGKAIGIVWQEDDGEWHGEHSKTGMSWATDNRKDMIARIKDHDEEINESDDNTGEYMLCQKCKGDGCSECEAGLIDVTGEFKRPDFDEKELEEGFVKRQMEDDAYDMNREEFIKKYGEESIEFYDNIAEPMGEGKWDYPKGMKGKGPAHKAIAGNPGKRNREERKAFRKAEKAKAHQARMRGEISLESVVESILEDFPGQPKDYFDADNDRVPVPISKAEKDFEKEFIDPEIEDEELGLRFD